MRTIKFRAWDEIYKYMNYKVIVGMWGKDVLDDENYTACSMWIDPKYVDYKCSPHWGHFEAHHNNIKLMQYTGIKDINGKEIYEGDIVKIEDGYEEHIGKIIYDKESVSYIFYSENKEIYFERTLDFINENICYVIGNIYENPELLGE